MDNKKIHFPAVIVSAIAHFVLGMIWYTAFGTRWMAYAGISEEAAKNLGGGDIAGMYGGALVCYVITFYCLAFINQAFQVKDAKGGMQSGFWSWLGFSATALYVSYAFAMRPIGLFLIDAGYWLIGLMIGGVILAVWRKKEVAAVAV
jgi:hypothetical protein